MDGNLRMNLNHVVRAGRALVGRRSLMAALVVLGLFLLIASAGRAAGDDPFVSADAIDGTILQPYDETSTTAFPTIPKNVPTSGTFRVDFDRPVTLAKPVVLRDVNSGVEQTIQTTLFDNGKALAIYAPNTLAPNTYYDLEVAVVVDGMEWSKTYRFQTGQVPPPAVDFTTPEAGTIDAPVDLAGVYFHYNSVMDPNSFNPSDFTIVDLTGNTAVPSNNMIYQDNRFVAMGVGSLPVNHLFQVDAKTGLRSKGEATAAAASFLFSTDDRAGGFPTGIDGVYPACGSNVDGLSPVAARYSEYNPPGLTTPAIWKAGDLTSTPFTDGSYTWDRVNSSLTVGVPRAQDGSDSSPHLTAWANLQAEEGQAQPFSGFAWGWTANRPTQFFTDVPTSDPHYPFVTSIQNLGYINGFPNGDGTFRFGGTQTLTRAQGAKIFVNAFGITVDPQSISTPFKDVPADANGYPAAFVNAAVAAGMVQGKTATAFDPSGALLYRHVILMEVRRLKQAFPASYFLEPPSDYDVGLGFPEANWAAYNGLLVGMGDKTSAHPLGDPATIDPFAPITRYDAAVAAADLTIALRLAGQ